MPQSKTFIFAASLMTLALAGCQSGRFTPMQSNAPAPLAAAPAGTVTSSQLPPPAQATSPSEFPEAPGGTGDTEMAALDPAAQAAAAAGAPEITAGSVAGVWSVSVAGENCRVATPQTKFGQGFRAGPLRCPAPMDGVKSWNVAGNQLAFYDESGQVLARLYSTGSENFSGQTTNGQPISLNR
ncbi:protease inhibitor Inh/omp19 family protein [Nitratireductor luteus]|uniref:protease inhibitor Inh/omp19 family protein n=1 Tax=Nitratireductor luteus TaxID=2976980 RepID=UPI00223F9BFB|nr:protease inhibitor Inh/omp19 family protein [Nitratireductor luteus]